MSVLGVIRHGVNANLNGTSDSGRVHVITADGVTLTLPPVADGVWYLIVDLSPASNGRIAPQAGEVVANQTDTYAPGVGLQNDAINSAINMLGISGLGWLAGGENTAFHHWN